MALPKTRIAPRETFDGEQDVCLAIVNGRFAALVQLLGLDAN